MLPGTRIRLEGPGFPPGPPIPGYRGHRLLAVRPAHGVADGEHSSEEGYGYQTGEYARKYLVAPEPPSRPSAWDPGLSFRGNGFHARPCFRGGKRRAFRRFLRRGPGRGRRTLDGSFRGRLVSARTGGLLGRLAGFPTTVSRVHPPSPPFSALYRALYFDGPLPGRVSYGLAVECPAYHLLSILFHSRWYSLSSFSHLARGLLAAPPLKPRFLVIACLARAEPPPRNVPRSRDPVPQLSHDCFEHYSADRDVSTAARWPRNRSMDSGSP